jgi:hypothetical protein
MAAPSSRLAIDLSGSLLRVVDGAPGGRMRCGSGGTVDESIVGGKIMDPAGVSSALKQLLARTEIRETRALVAVSDSLATFRVMKLPVTATDAIIDTAVAKEFSFDPDQMGIKWADVHMNNEYRLIYATAWDRSLIKSVTDVVKGAGLNPIVVDLKSACIARVVSPSSCIVVDISSNPVDIFLIDDHLPQLWHSIELEAPGGEDISASLAPELRTVMRFSSRRRDFQFGPQSPILISGDQMPSSQVLANLSRLLEHPVEALPSPARVPDIRYGAYLTCLGLLMRRS